MLLPIEVAAFHPGRVVLHTRQTRLCGPVPRHFRAGRLLAAIAPCGVRTFLDKIKFAAIAQPALRTVL